METEHRRSKMQNCICKRTNDCRCAFIRIFSTNCSLDSTNSLICASSTEPHAMSKYKTHCKCQNPMIWSISPSEIHPQTPDRLPDETRRTCSSDGNPNVIAKIHNLRGAVEGGDGVAIVLGVLQKLEEVVSSDNSGRDVAGSNHGCSCLDPVGQLAAEEELWQIFCCSRSRKKRERVEARTR